ncbi:MAG: sel1 repeat family protein [Betaproteobacteria bacterium]|nr:MAG: sel1 repeat family protein [Betaproteobacteria bacterium]
MTQPRPQERYARALLLLTLLHTVPVIWITPVAGGTAPTAALLAFGLASVSTFEREGVAIGLFVLGPAVVYCTIGWLIAWLGGKALEKLRQPIRTTVLAVVVIALLASVYWPIYVAGTHNASRSVNLIELFDDTPGKHALLGYWIGVQALLVALFAGYLLRDKHPVLNLVERWRKPAVTTISAALIAGVLVGNYPKIVCRPLAELGSGRAALCVAKSTRTNQRLWYERAAEKGQADAIAWVIDHTPGREQRLYWLRKGAERGDAAIQFALYERLMRTPGPNTRAEAEMWLHRSAEGDYPRAQLALVDKLTRAIHSAQSQEKLTERNRWLERAARLDARDAKRRLAQHYIDGSMGFPADLKRARSLYSELVEIDEQTRYESTLGLDANYYSARIAEVDAWRSGLSKGDPEITKLFAERYLSSRFPGPGVRELGLQLLEGLAEAGDSAARDALIFMLRTGSGGVERNPATAKRWLIIAAEAGDAGAMEHLADNYANGREGFNTDYPEAQRWFRAAIESYGLQQTDAAQSRVRALRNELDHIDRLAEQAGGTLLGAQELEKLGQRRDAESHYQYAVQLLAGHGSERRVEAIERLNKASRKGHADAAWRLFQIYERGFPTEIDQAAAIDQLHTAAANHHFDATRELAMRYEYGKRGVSADLPRAIAMYEEALDAGHDNRYGWNLDSDNFYHFKWLESRLRQARMKQTAQPGR